MKILSLLISAFALLAPGLARAAGNWKTHINFDEDITRIIDTGDFVYFLSRCEPYDPKISVLLPEKSSLFRYDKEADELMALSVDNLLADNVVSKIEYSPEKGMLVVVYTNSDIDIIYDNGKVTNIPAYRLASLSTGKEVNSIFIDPDRDRVYLSTEFGYVALNDKKGEVAESRIYNLPVTGMSRLGDNLLLLQGDKLYAAPADAPRFNINDYSLVHEFEGAESLTYVSDGYSVVVDTSEKPQRGWLVQTTDAAPKQLFTSRVYNIERNKEGVLLVAADLLRQLGHDGKLTDIRRDTDDWYLPAGSSDLREIWVGARYKGIKSMRYDAGGERKFTLTRDWIAPRAPAPFKVTDMAYHPDYGMMVVNHGYSRLFSEAAINSPILLSANDNGFWQNLSPVFTNPDHKVRVKNPNGLCIDPDNPKYVYFGSALNGMMRINLEDGTDILHLSRAGDAGKDLPGFVALVPDRTTGGWKSSCIFSAPEIDADGNLWFLYATTELKEPSPANIFCWEAADRRASTSAENFRPMKQFQVELPRTSYYMTVKPMKAGANKGLLLLTTPAYTGFITVLDTNGTPSDQSDDKVVTIRNFVDQDGSEFDLRYVQCFYEDPATGNVWVGHEEGVFYFNPRTAVGGNTRVNRVKVARNDGTNLADYLLNLVNVQRIAVDGAGRKWFATIGGGAICTSADGRTIEEEVTAENSGLPDNTVYGLGYNPANNSMFFSTDRGIAEYYLSGSAGSGAMDEVRAYPNPVRPDYYGYVTIDGLPDGALVKIANAGGHVVKELGFAAGGEAKWDVTDLSFRRVNSGVYFILCSTDADGGALANVGKVLVIN